MNSIVPKRFLVVCGIEGFYIYDPSLLDSVPAIDNNPSLLDPVPVINDRPKLTESQSNVSTNDINNEEKVIARKKYAVVDSDSRVVILDQRRQIINVLEHRKHNLTFRKKTFNYYI